jgi:uncharacterized protein YkwD
MLGVLVSALLAALIGAFALLAAVARAVARGAPVSPCPGADLRPTPLDAAAVEAASVCLINEVRSADGLPALRLNGSLQRVATTQIGQMVRLNYFAHVRPSGQTPGRLIAHTRYAAHAASLSTGENIGWGTGSDSTPASLVAAWMRSPPHRAVILAARFRNIGVSIVSELPAVLEQDQHGALYAAEFAARR